jgi:hypothetical protein
MPRYRTGINDLTNRNGRKRHGNGPKQQRLLGDAWALA